MQQIKSCLLRISDTLLINGGFLDNPGLYSGEMGLALFFFRYARFTENKLYSDYGFDLIEKIQNRIHRETPIDYKGGLAGIGSTIEYLIQEEYIEADADEILEEFDDRMFSTENLHNLTNEELLSIGYYTQWRLLEKGSKKESIPNRFTKFIVQNVKPEIQKLNFPIPDTFHLLSMPLGIQNGLAGLGLSLLSELDGNDSWTSLFPNNLPLIIN